MLNFENSKLYGISNKKYLSELLQIELSKLKDIETHYSTPPFQKKTNKGKLRTLYNPHNDYKRILQRLNSYLRQIPAPEYILGGIQKRSHVMNGSIHKDNDYFLLLDLKDFFPSTTDKHVYNLFKHRLNMSTDIAKICTLLTTEPSHKSKIRHLPQGYATSPYLSFLSYYDMYNKVENVARSENITFSCYYDDFTFSSPTFIPKAFKKRIIGIIEDYGLQVNKQKTRLCVRKDNGVKITGTIIRSGQLKAPNNLQLKMFRYFEELIETYENISSEAKLLIELCNKVQGCLTAIKHIEPDRSFPYISSKIKEVREFARNKVR
jgi:RNA-directed DNA polymerase